MKPWLTVLLSALLAVQASLAQAAPEGETITYYLTDHLGTPVVATDEQGNLLWERQYSAFGEAESHANDVQVGHTGHEFVPESGLSYMGARWYHPELGRFLQPDPAGFVPSNSLSFNRYLYVNNNPFQYIDPDGRYLAPAKDMANKMASAIPTKGAETGLQDMGSSVSNGVSLGSAATPGGLAPVMSAQEYAAKSSASATGVVGGWIATDTVLPDPTDALPHKWVGYGIAIGAAAAADWTVGKIIGAFAKSGNSSDDKRLSPGEIGKLIDGGTHPHDLKPKKNGSKYDLFKDKEGNIIVKPKDGSGPGDPTGLNIDDF